MICDGGQALFTVLTDCYGTKDYNHIHHVMQMAHTNRIDAFIWTHPDKDHSVDIPAILGKYDPGSKAQVFLPSALNRHMGLSEDAQMGLDYVMKHYNSNTRYDANYVFCGDLSEQNVKFIDPDLLENAVFIKIPHHGTDRLKTFVPKFISKGVKDAVSVTTVFKKQGLPKESVLNEYASISKGIYCTSDINKSPNVTYGCVAARFYAYETNSVIETDGNAYCHYHV